MSELHVSAKPDTTDMMAVHKVFRRAFGDVTRLVQEAPVGDGGRAGVVASYYDNILHFLDVHHGGEDALIWPKLIDRCPEQTELIGRMIANHGAVHEAMGAASAAIPAWAAAADGQTAEALTSAIARLGDVLIPHLDDEEREIVPLCTDHLTMEEWGALPGHALGHFGGDKVWLILGLIRENMTRAQRDAMLEHMPPPARDMWTNMGNAAFDEFIAEVRRPLG